VLLIAALASVIAINMLSRHQLVVAKTRQVLYGTQALDYALGAEAWVRALLFQDFEGDTATPRIDGVNDLWAQTDAPFEIEQGTLEIRVRDLDGLFNLNGLDDPASVERFRRLLTALALDPALADVIVDWVDSDQEVQGTGAEDGRYLVQDPPYRAANGPFASVTELMLLPDLGSEAYARLSPYVAALPVGIRLININTAPWPVLSALAPGMNPAQAGSYARPETPWAMPGELTGREAGFAPELGAMTVQSRFFEVLARAEFAGQTVTLRSVIYRDPETGTTQVLARDLGKRFETWGLEADPDADGAFAEDA
jgi:general secretion pathway protein K